MQRQLSAPHVTMRDIYGYILTILCIIFEKCTEILKILDNLKYKISAKIISFNPNFILEHHAIHAPISC